MSLKEIEKYEGKALFKVFLRRIGILSFDEYLKLFGDDIQKREEAVSWFRQTYPNLSTITN